MIGGEKTAVAEGGRERVARWLVTSCADVPIHHKLLYSYYIPSDSVPPLSRFHPGKGRHRAPRRAGVFRFCARIYRPRLALDGTDRDYVTTTPPLPLCASMRRDWRSEWRLFAGAAARLIFRS